MKRRTLSFPLALALPLTLLVPVACIEDEGDIDAADVVDDEVDVRSGLVGGIKLNSGLVGGIKLNTNELAQEKLLTLTKPSLGGTVHGHRLRTVTFAGDHAGKAWNNVVYLSDQTTGRIAFKTTGGVTLSGGDLDNTVLGFDTNGDNTADLDVRIEKEILDSSPPSGSIYYYKVQTRATGSGAAFKSLCAGDDFAVFADGDWSSDPIDRLSSRGDTANGDDTITLACVDGAIHKCIVNGKRPTDAAGEDRHETCVRAFVAAYGGHSMTSTGNPIDIHEKSGASNRFRVDGGDLSNQTDFVKEAEWSREGALCVNRQALRMPGMITNCPSDPATRTVANCVVKDANGNDIPECAASFDYSNNFEYASGLMVTYSSTTASQTGYDPVKDVAWGVKTAATGPSTLFKGIVKSGLQAIAPIGPTQISVQAASGDWVLNPVRIDGLFYSELHATLMGFEFDEGNNQSRLVRIRPNGRIYRLGVWFPGRVRGAEAHRNGTQVHAVARAYGPDASSPHNKMLVVDVTTGDLKEVREILKSDLTPVEINDADVSRQPGVPNRPDWFLVTKGEMYSFDNIVQTINGKPSIVLNPVLRSDGGRTWAGLAYAHPTRNYDGNPDNNAMTALDVDGVDKLVFADLFAPYSLNTFFNPAVPEIDAVSGDLAAYVPAQEGPVAAN